MSKSLRSLRRDKAWQGTYLVNPSDIVIAFKEGLGLQRSREPISHRWAEFVCCLISMEKLLGSLVWIFLSTFLKSMKSHPSWVQRFVHLKPSHEGLVQNSQNSWLCISRRGGPTCAAVRKELFDTLEDYSSHLIKSSWDALSSRLMFLGKHMLHAINWLSCFSGSCRCASKSSVV